MYGNESHLMSNGCMSNGCMSNGCMSIWKKKKKSNLLESNSYMCELAELPTAHEYKWMCMSPSLMLCWN